MSDFPIDSQWVNAGPHIFLGIYDTYKVSPDMDDSSIVDSVLRESGAPATLVHKYYESRDSSTKFAFPLKINHRYVYIDETMFKKPRFSIESLPKKYVSKYCRVGFSKPTISIDSLTSIAYMFSPCMNGGATYLLRKKDNAWQVFGRSPIQRSYYGEPLP